jgi:AraC family transcriptional regulator of adaptative response/methylated-DNA-[protein]-cysteine methyltransferase
VTQRSSAARARAALVEKDERWTAIQLRDPRAAFLYSVVTTGVYCRPACSARRPRPEHVAFHASAAAAQRAGFRACKRCRPDQPPADERRAAQIAELCRLIEQSDERLSLHELAGHAGLSPFHTHRLFKSVTGVTPRAYAEACRAGRLRRALGSERNITDAIYSAGFGSSSRFYEKGDGLLGMTASRYRSGGAGLEIRFSNGRCSLGSILVAATGRGVCAILLGDDPAELAGDLERHFPRARLVRGGIGFNKLVAEVVTSIEDPARGSALPLDIQGTAFQQRVWKALSEIPAGTTRSYAEVARSLGSPRAARAVARACARNPIAVVIPCHRVVASDGKLTGYRWGLERKRALLEREAKVRLPKSGKRR